MENNNLNPEEENLQQDDGETTEISEAVTASASADDEEVAAMTIDDSQTVMPVAEPPVKKGKKGLIVGVAAAVLAIAVVGGFAVMSQSPERLVPKAMKATYARALKSSEQMNTDLPMIAKSTEFATKSTKTDAEYRVNSVEMPGVTPMVSMLMSGTTLSGTTTANPATSTYSNSYSLNVLGQTAGTINLFNSPAIISVGVPEYIGNSYYLDVDKMVVDGWDSVLFSQLIPTKKEDLQAASNLYKAYINYFGSMNAESIKVMTTRFAEILTKNMTEAQYGKLKLEGKKFYTVTIPAESVNAMLTESVKYLYLESPLLEMFVTVLDEATMAEFTKQINDMANTIGQVMPTSPTVVTMSIEKGIISSVNVLTEDVIDGEKENALVGNRPEHMRLNIDVVGLVGANSTVALKAEIGESVDKIALDMTVQSTYVNKALQATVGMKVISGSANEMLNLLLNYGLDGNKSRSNLSFDMVYDIADPISNIRTKILADTVGDYYVEGEAVVLNMGKINYGIDSTAPGGTAPISLKMNLGMKQTTAPFEGEITQPKGIDVLTLSANDINAIYAEAQASLQKVLMTFLGKLAV